MFYKLCIILYAVQSVATLKEGEECVDSRTNSKGVCTLLSKCQTSLNDFENKSTLPTLCSHSFDIVICCSEQNQINNTNSDDSQLEGSFENSKDNVRLSERKCAEYSSVVNETSYLNSLPEATVLVEPKYIHNGNQVIGVGINPGDFPHLAAVGFLDMAGNYTFLCTGSLISPRFVLTVAHCTKVYNSRFKDSNPQIVRLGDQNLDPTVEDGVSPIDVPIKTIHKHPDYTDGKKYNDIALLELNKDVDFTLNIRPACLWTKPNFPGYTSAIAAGWSFVNSGEAELTKVSLKLVENDFCNRNSFKLVPNWNGVSDSQMCADELRGGTACRRDSGSPLQVASHHNNGILYVIGVTSYGKTCGETVIYTRVSSFTDWIEGIVWPEE